MSTWWLMTQSGQSFTDNRKPYAYELQSYDVRHDCIMAASAYYNNKFQARISFETSTLNIRTLIDLFFTQNVRHHFEQMIREKTQNWHMLANHFQSVWVLNELHFTFKANRF